MTLPPSYVALKVDESGAANVTGNLGINFISGDYSISAWIQYDGFSSNAVILERAGEFQFRTTDNGFSFQIEGRPPLVWQSAADLGDDWINVCLTFSSGTVRLFVNGQFETLVSMGEGSTSNSNPLVIGTGLQGLVRNVILYSNALTPQQVVQGLFGPLPSTLIAANFDFTQNPPVDTGPLRLPIALTSGAKSVRVTPCLRFPTGGFAYPMHDPDVNPGGQSVDAYTVQAWVYLYAGAPQQYVFANSDLDSDTGMSLSIVQNGDSYYLMSKRGSDQDGASVSSAQSIPLRAWTNVATTFDGLNLVVYVNGVASGTLNCPPLPLMRNEGDVVIGATFSDTVSGGIDTINGCVSHVYVWNQALSAADLTTYMTDHPPAGTAGLTGNFNLTAKPTRNSVNGHPVGLVGGPRIYQQVANSEVGAGDQTPLAAAAQFETSATPEMLRRWRAETDFAAIATQVADGLAHARKIDADRFDSTEDKATIEDAYDDVSRRVALGDHPDMVPLYTRHEENGRRYLVVHYGDGSHVVYEGSAAEISECALWEVQLLFIAVGGVLDALFGLKASLTPAARGLIAKILFSPRITAIMARGARITAGGIVAMMGTIYSLGYVKPLLWAVVDLGVWAIIRVVVRWVLDLVGVGAAAVLASLAATVASFIAWLAQRPASCSPLPTVTLASIAFNHDPTHASVDALSIRKSATRDVHIPEWTKGQTDPKTSPAAYAIDKVTGKTITIEASFTINTTAATTVQIQALGGGVLGPVAPVTVNFVNGVSSPKNITLNLPSHSIATQGVTAQDVTWTWQYQIQGGAWQPMSSSSHRIYTLLSQPTMPWKQSADPSETQLPWTDALEYACAWANGKTTAGDALAAVTTQVNGALGLTYETTRGASKYTGANATGTQFAFFLTKFNQMLGGGFGNGKKVNCTDCATIVATFANLVGTDVQASIMQDVPLGAARSGFKCNEIQAVGFSTWGYPFPPGNGFSYHEVVWAPTTGNRSHIHDACLKFDSSNDPWNWGTGTTHTPVLPVNYQFTSQTLPTPLPIPTPFTAQTYRERLAQNTATGIAKCIPQGPKPYSQNGRRMVE